MYLHNGIGYPVNIVKKDAKDRRFVAGHVTCHYLTTMKPNEAPDEWT